MPPRKVLIVEDDADIRLTLCAALELDGYAVQAVQNGLEGVDALQNFLPDLILLDLMMPVMTGWEFLSIARVDVKTAKIPVIILSAGELKSEKPDSTYLIKKPFDLLDLLKTVESLVKKLGQ